VRSQELAYRLPPPLRFAQFGDLPQKRDYQASILMSSVPDRYGAIRYMPFIFIKPGLFKVDVRLHPKMHANCHNTRIEGLEIAGQYAAYLALMYPCFPSQFRWAPVPLLHVALNIGKENPLFIACKFHANMHNLESLNLQLASAPLVVSPETSAYMGGELE
jgi:hypothetical protein